MKSYLICYEFDKYLIIEAETPYEVIMKFAEYAGDDGELFKKAVRGLDKIDDYVEMFNHFANVGDNITHIYELGTKIYDEDAAEESEGE